MASGERLLDGTAKKKVLAALRSEPVTTRVLVHLQQVVRSVGCAEEVSCWLQDGLTDSCLALLKNLPGELPTKDAAQACGLVAGILARAALVAKHERIGQNPVQIAEALAADRAAAAALVNWGILSPGSEEPACCDVVGLRLDVMSHHVAASGDSQAAEKLREVWSVRVLSLYGTCYVLSSLGSGAVIHPAAKEVLVPAITREVVEHLLALPAKHGSGLLWDCLKHIAQIDPYTTRRLLQQLRPQLRQALRSFPDHLLELDACGVPGAVRDGCLDEPLQLAGFLEPRRSPDLPEKPDEDPRWDLMLLSVDAVFGHLRNHGFATAPHALDHNLLIALKSITSALEDAVDTGPIQKVLMQDNMLLKWVSLLPEMSGDLQLIVIMLVAAALNPGKARMGQVTSSVKVVSKLLSERGMEHLCQITSTATCQRVQAMGACTLSKLIACQEEAGNQRPLLQHLDILGSAIHWESFNQKHAYLALNFSSAFIGRITANPAYMSAFGGAASAEAFITNALQCTGLGDCLGGVIEELQCLTELVHMDARQDEQQKAQARQAWILAVGDCIEAGTSAAWMGSAVTKQELWDWVAAATCQSCSGLQLQKLHQGYKANGIAGNARVQHSAATLAARLRRDRLQSSSAAGLKPDIRSTLLTVLASLQQSALYSPQQAARAISSRCGSLLLACIQHPQRDVRGQAAGILLLQLMMLTKSYDEQEQRHQQRGRGKGLLLLNEHGNSVIGMDDGAFVAAFAERMAGAERWGTDATQWDSCCPYVELDAWLVCAPEALKAREPAAAAALVTGWRGWSKLRRWSLRADAAALRTAFQTAEDLRRGRQMDCAGVVFRLTKIVVTMTTYAEICGSVPWAAAEGWLAELEARCGLQTGPQALPWGASPGGQQVASAGGRPLATGKGARAGPAAEAAESLGEQACCDHCGGVAPVGGRLSVCGGCRSTRYCSKDCQRADWKAHRASCRMQQQGPK